MNDVAIIDHLLATGEILPSQLPTTTSWSPAKRLAAAVLASALIMLRDHQGDAVHARDVEEDLAWLRSDATGEPFAFLRLCEVFALDAAWVREVVVRWGRDRRSGRRRAFSMHRHAA
jgi:hypothetical protein